MSRPKEQPDFFSAQISDARRFYMDLNPPKSVPLAVMAGGCEHCSADYEIHRAGFPCWGLEFVARGRGELALNGRTFPLAPGAIFSYGPRVAQDIVSDPKETLVKYFVDFAGTRAPGLLRSCKLSPGSISHVYPPNVLQPLFDELIQCGSRLTRGSAEMSVKLLECIALRISGSHAPIDGAETLAFSTYQHSRQHIERHFQALRSLDQISSECHVSAAYLCRLFRRYDSQTPYQFLLRLKMNFAAERIQRSGAMVKQVAEEAGFADPFHFSRAFKTVLGLSPAAFRALR